jgi:carbon monoxide dehydrogenase subunit G
MEFTGRYVIAAPPENVWAALNDPAILRACIPGCEHLARVEPQRFDATASLRIGPVKATFRAVVEQSEIDPPHRCVLTGEGRGGVAGFARGRAEVLLVPEGKATMLSYTAGATVGGKLAQLGQRLIDGAARQIADDFFARFAAQLAVVPDRSVEAALLTPPGTGSEAPAPQIPDSASDIRREGLAPEIWVIGLIAVIVILLVLFGVAL